MKLCPIQWISSWPYSLVFLKESRRGKVDARICLLLGEGRIGKMGSNGNKNGISAQQAGIMGF